MTNNPERIDKILTNLGLIWSRVPEQRFFQMLFNYTKLGTRTHVGCVRDPFHYDDEDFLVETTKIVEYFLDEEKKRDKKKFILKPIKKKVKK
jgi:hypothetical protein